MPLAFNSSFRIRLANTGNSDAARTIRPGEILYGQVEYKPASVERLTALTVYLLGKLIVQAPKRQREVTQVFGVQHPIIRQDEEPVELEAQLYKFPFHFVIPWTTEYDRSSTLKEDPEGRFVQAPHMVPPSLGLKAKGNAQILYSCYAIGRKQGIRANTFAALQDIPKGQELENIQCVVELAQAPPNPAQTVYKTLLPQAPGNNSRRIFRRSSIVAPSIEEAPSGGDCGVTLTGPKYAIIGDAFTIQVSVDYHDRSCTATSNHFWNVSVKRFDLVVKSYRRMKDAAETWSEEWSMPLLVMQRPLPIEAGKGQEIEIRMKDKNMVTSFKTYTISRFHHLRVELVNVVERTSNRTGYEFREEIDMPIEVIRLGEPLTRRFSGPARMADINGMRVLPPAYEESPQYQERRED